VEFWDFYGGQRKMCFACSSLSPNNFLNSKYVHVHPKPKNDIFYLNPLNILDKKKILW